MKFAVAGELRRQRSGQNLAFGVSTKGHRVVRSLKVASWGSEERCEGRMAEMLRGSGRVVRPWRRLWSLIN